MNISGKQRFKQELEAFIVEKLRPSMEIISLKQSIFSVDYQQPNNHELCKEMFWNAYRDRSPMYVQMPNLHQRRMPFSDEEEMLFYFSLSTLQMFVYDDMMFSAMRNSEDEAYANAAKKYFRPYIFGYVTNIDCEKYDQLCKLQDRLYGDEMDLASDEAESQLWFKCTFNQSKDLEPIYELDGYMLEAASDIKKRDAILKIIETPGTELKKIKKQLDKYTIRECCLKDDAEIIDTIKKYIPSNPLCLLDIYRLGNGNCVCAADKNLKNCFFYDVGFNCKQRPKRITAKGAYNYSNSMKAISSRKPEMIILSHWDTDHILGSVSIGKSIYDIPWIAPDCHDASLTAIRIAKYLDLKGNLYLVARPSSIAGKSMPTRRIGKIREVDHSYQFYMGNSVRCDSSKSNCEGIVIEYKDVIKDCTVLMMGDVNYTSFNNARASAGESLFADMNIDYLIVPHHGSKHTDYIRIMNTGTTAIKGKIAVICCDNNKRCKKKSCENNRPYDEHKDYLEKRFQVLTTEDDAVKPAKVSVQITL